MFGTSCRAVELDDGAVWIDCRADSVAPAPSIAKLKFDVPALPMREALVRFIGQANAQRSPNEVAIQGAYYCERGPFCFDIKSQPKAYDFSLPVCSRPVVGELRSKTLSSR